MKSNLAWRAFQLTMCLCLLSGELNSPLGYIGSIYFKIQFSYPHTEVLMVF